MIIVLFLAGLFWILIGVFLMTIGSSGRVSVVTKLGDFGGTISLVVIFIGIILLGIDAFA